VKQADPALQGKVLVSRNSLAEYVEGCLRLDIMQFFQLLGKIS
jgi:hypothetical protein